MIGKDTQGLTYYECWPQYTPHQGAPDSRRSGILGSCELEIQFQIILTGFHGELSHSLVKFAADLFVSKLQLISA